MILESAPMGDALYWRTLGRAFRVLAVSDNDDEANAYMERNPVAAVISVIGKEGGPRLVVIADKWDEGVKI